jgi:hypothetical protein
MNQAIQKLICCTVALLAFMTTSCSKSAYPVEGQVVFENDAPANELAGSSITFEIKDKNVSATGTIKPDGTFLVGTFTDNDGAPPGKHRVVITPPPQKIDEPRQPPLIAKKYESFDTSGLAADIEAKANKITIKVQRMK